MEGQTILAGTPIKVVKTGLNQTLTYKEIWNAVKEFSCGLYLTELYLLQNEGVEITLALNLYDAEGNAYVYLDANAAWYIGHTFAKQDGETLKKAQLTDVVIASESTSAWSSMPLHRSPKKCSMPQAAHI